MSKPKAEIEIQYNKYGNKIQPRKIIRCPHCCYDYLPSEIFYDYNMIGKPTKIIRDPLGKILYEEYEPGKEPTVDETFNCVNCHNDFVVEVEISYKASDKPEEINFRKDTTSLW